MPATMVDRTLHRSSATVWGNGGIEVVIGPYAAISDCATDEINTWLEASESTKGCFDWFLRKNLYDKRLFNLVYLLTDANTAFLLKLKYATGS